MASASIEKDPRFKHILTDPRFNVRMQSDQILLCVFTMFSIILAGTQTC